MPLPLPASLKRSRLRPAVQAYNARANLTFPNQNNRQEDENDPTEANTSVPDDNSQTIHQVDQAEAQQTIIAQQKILDSLRKDLDEANRKLMMARIACKNLRQRVEDLTVKDKETALWSLEMPFQLPLQRPEENIVEAWNELASDVKNLVSDRFGELGRPRTVAWASRQREHLKILTPDYMSVVTETNSSAAFIEAAIWHVLCMCIFGSYQNNTPFRWAGKYRASLGTISKGLIVTY